MTMGLVFCDTESDPDYMVHGVLQLVPIFHVKHC